METIFKFGFLLGITHALEPDHLLALSTMTSGKIFKKQLVYRSAAWGVGHSITISTICIFSYIFGFILPDALSAVFESIVGIMLFVLGVELLIRLKKSKIHLHFNTNEAGKRRIHLHSHYTPSLIKALFVGFVHGLAGSGVFITLAIASVGNNFVQTVYYCIVFSIGSILAMISIGFLIAWPLKILETTYFKVLRILRIISGLGAIIFGISILLDINILI